MVENFGSKIPARNAFGQNGSNQAASLVPGETKPNIAGVSPPTVNVPDDKWQTRSLEDRTAKSETPAPIHPAMQSRTASSGSPGGAIPKAALSRVR